MRRRKKKQHDFELKKLKGKKNSAQQNYQPHQNEVISCHTFFNTGNLFLRRNEMSFFLGIAHHHHHRMINGLLHLYQNSNSKLSCICFIVEKKKLERNWTLKEREKKMKYPENCQWNQIKRYIKIVKISFSLPPRSMNQKKKKKYRKSETKNNNEKFNWLFQTERTTNKQRKKQIFLIFRCSFSVCLFDSGTTFDTYTWIVLFFFSLSRFSFNCYRLSTGILFCRRYAASTTHIYMIM